MTTRLFWVPDTCSCRFYEHQEHDGSGALISVTSEIITLCDAHAALKDDAEVALSTVKEEVRRKNYVTGVEVLAAMPEDCKEQVVDPQTGVPSVEENGDPIMTFKKGCEPTWYFNEERELVIGLPQVAKVAIPDVVAAVVDAEYEKVIIE